METMPSAMVKDLLSTGFFYEELKNYTDSKEIDLSSYSRNYAIPYLTKILESHDRSGQVERSEILNLAIKHLADVSDDELADSILGLKKLASSAIDSNEKALHQIDHEDKSQTRACRRKSESAQSLAKLLVSIIRLFKLPEVIAKRGAPQTVVEAIMDTRGLSVLPT